MLKPSFILACLLIPAHAGAQAIYTCEQAGHRVHQSDPCPAGSRQVAERPYTDADTGDESQAQRRIAQYERELAARRAAEARQYRPVYRAPRSDATRERCQTAQRRRDQLRSRYRGDRKIQYFRQLDRMVYDACNGPPTR